ncbi:hypothetical protein [Bradyrhizobium sp. CCBAU 25338]|uniref:hypothetical protein n=1 Tax=Bradyrhizobium sp. CCBAU 25338 TaxID=1641877 RepID=UPI003FA4D368
MTIHPGEGTSASRPAVYALPILQRHEQRPEAARLQAAPKCSAVSVTGCPFIVEPWHVMIERTLCQKDIMAFTMDHLPISFLLWPVWRTTCLIGVPLLDRAKIAAAKYPSYFRRSAEVSSLMSISTFGQTLDTSSAYSSASF